MPRTNASSLKSSVVDKGNNQITNENDNSENTTTTAAEAPPTTATEGKNNNNNNNNINHNIKKEFVSASAPAEVQVVHRKSERRRVARDIFLVFEEQSTRRRGRGAKGKPTRAKQKFGHLRVHNPKPSKCILREIKTEPKCAPTEVLSAPVPPELNITAITAQPLPSLPQPTIVAEEEPTSEDLVQQTKAQNVSVTFNGGKDCKSNANTKSAIKVETKTALNALKTTATKGSNGTVERPVSTPVRTTTSRASSKSKTAAATSTPSVNPIFLWVKQDDTRIVEVRCEDYDKRNRIRLTKTTNGWRSMPRTDASSTRIVKFFQNSTSPLLKVKREAYENQQLLLQQQQEEQQHQHQQQLEQEQQLVHQQQQFELSSVDVVVAPPLMTIPAVASSPSELCPQPVSMPISQTLMEDWNEIHSNPLESNMAYTPPEIVDDVLVMPPSVAPTLAMHDVTEELIDEPTPPPSEVLPDVCFDALMENGNGAGDAIKPGKLTPIERRSTTPQTTNTTATTYQSSTPPMELHLCPKTGLFLPKSAASADTNTDGDVECDEVLEKPLLDEIRMESVSVSNTKASSIERRHDEDIQDVVGEVNNCVSAVTVDNVESLEANTKNLKDLLDDADLLQHCSSDNGSCGADLLDSLVKRSCEDNLVQDTSSSTTTAATVTAAEAMMKDALSSFSICADLNELAAKDLPPILDMVGDAPKCLSFNEAGEIEGLNGELFQSNNFIDSFEKEPLVVAVNATEPEDDHERTPHHLSQHISNEKIVDETPKDLSYKKREEVCPPSESRSQCVVTSSSDILKSPTHESLGGGSGGGGSAVGGASIPVEVEATSETIKNLILEQFIKLNALNQLPGMPAVASQQQAEPIDLGKSRDKLATSTNAVTATPVTTNRVGNSTYLETVVLDEDDEEEEPLKKRHCSGGVKSTIKMDKDPDPLTQLKMLINNSQWKVPDPILVPKDRLGAVLASPAREIPLLLTTRPELRLPEAFAYPEIIQNPNILVISMAQLEAILKNETEEPQSKQASSMLGGAVNNVVPVSPKVAPHPKEIINHHHKPRSQPSPLPPAKVTPPPRPVSNKCAHTPPQPADSSLATDINAATLAVLQQMLWLPYFGQLSQEFFKTLKDPLGIQRKLSNNNMQMPPFYNNQTFGLQHLDELYKHYVKQMTSSAAATTTGVPAKHREEPPAPPPPPKVQPTPPPHLPPPVPQQASFNGFSNPVELAFFQKLFQPQMPNFLNMNAAAVAAAAAASANAQQAPSKSNAAELHLEQKRSRRNALDAASAGLGSSGVSSLEPLNIPDFNSNFSSGSNGQQTPKTPVEKKQQATPPVEHKPRLVVKSLSNLLEPENINSGVPLLNVPFDGLRRSVQHQKSNKSNAASTEPTNGQHGSNTRTLRSSKACVTYNPLEQAKQPSTQRKRSNLPQQHHGEAHAEATAVGMRNAEASVGVNAVGLDANSALWHPLFGSNPKQGYNSPWQWTTVTATGE